MNINTMTPKQVRIRMLYETYAVYTRRPSLVCMLDKDHPCYIALRTIRMEDNLIVETRRRSMATKPEMTNRSREMVHVTIVYCTADVERVRLLLDKTEKELALAKAALVCEHELVYGYGYSNTVIRCTKCGFRWNRM